MANADDQPKLFYYRTTLKQHFLLSDEDIWQLGRADEIREVAGNGSRPGPKLHLYCRERVHRFVAARIEAIEAEFTARERKAEQALAAIRSSREFVRRAIGASGS